MGNDVYTTLSGIQGNFEEGLSVLPSAFVSILVAAIGFILIYSIIRAIVKIVGSFF